MHKHKARKRFGQNFLVDQSVIRTIIETIAPQGEDYFIEIGPGKGALTRYLLPTCRFLDAIELDRDLIPLLKINLATHSQKINIINQDVLQVDFCKLQQRFSQKARIVGNLPYNISTPLMLHLIGFRNCFSDLHFMLQNEVVLRLTAKAGTRNYGRLSIIMQYYFDVEKCFQVPPTAFKPAPKVESAIVALRPWANLQQQHGVILKEEDKLSRITKMAFAQRRKTLGNNLKNFFTTESLLALGIEPKLRAEQLSLADYIRLANALAD